MNKHYKKLMAFILSCTILVPAQPLSEALPPLLGAVVSAIGLGGVGYKAYDKHSKNEEFTNKEIGLGTLIVGSSLLLGFGLHRLLWSQTPTGRYDNAHELLKKLGLDVPNADVQLQEGLLGQRIWSELDQTNEYLEKVFEEIGNKKNYEALRKKALVLQTQVIKAYYQGANGIVAGIMKTVRLGALLSNDTRHTDDTMVLNLARSIYSDTASWLTQSFDELEQSSQKLARVHQLLAPVFRAEARTQEIKESKENAHTLRALVTQLQSRIERFTTVLSYYQRYMQVKETVDTFKTHPRISRFCTFSYAQVRDKDFIDALRSLYSGQQWFVTAQTEFSQLRDKIAQALSLISELDRSRVSLTSIEDIARFKTELNRTQTLLEPKCQLIDLFATYTKSQEEFDALFARNKATELLFSGHEDMTDGQLWAWGKDTYRQSWGSNDWQQTMAQNLDAARSKLNALRSDLARVIETSQRGDLHQQCRELKRKLDHMAVAARTKYDLVQAYNGYRQIKLSMQELIRGSRLHEVLNHQGLQMSDRQLATTLQRLFSSDAWPLLSAEEALKEATISIAELVGNASRLGQEMSDGVAVKTRAMQQRVLTIQDTIVQYLSRIRSNASFLHQVEQKRRYDNQQQQRRDEQRLRERQRRENEQRRRQQHNHAQHAQNAYQQPNVQVDVQAEREQNEQEAYCAICLEGYAAADQIVVLGCCENRQFIHRDCYNDLINSGRRTCPLCRNDNMQPRHTTYGMHRG